MPDGHSHATRVGQPSMDLGIFVNLRGGGGGGGRKLSAIHVPIGPSHMKNAMMLAMIVLCYCHSFLLSTVICYCFSKRTHIS